MCESLLVQFHESPIFKNECSEKPPKIANFLSLLYSLPPPHISPSFRQFYSSLGGWIFVLVMDRCEFSQNRGCGSCFGCGILKNRGCGSNAVMLKLITAVAVAVIT